MSEEQGASFPQIRSRDGDFDKIKGKTGQSVEPWEFKVEGEEGGYGGNERVAESRDGVGIGSAATACPEEAIAFHGGTLGQMKKKAAFVGGPDGLNAVLGENFDFGPAGRFG
jgi:hypothetical protein